MARSNCQALHAKPGKLIKRHGRNGHEKQNTKVSQSSDEERRRLSRLLIMPYTVLAIVVVAVSAFCCALGESNSQDAADEQSQQVDLDPERSHLQLLNARMLESEQTASGSGVSLSAYEQWLESTLAMDRHLVATGAPREVREYTLSEIQRIALRYFPWNSLLSNSKLLHKVTPVLAERMLMQDEISTCCFSDGCLHDQVSTVMMFHELSMSDAAAQHLQRVKDAVIENDGSPSCRGMVWQTNRVSAPADKHFPSGYEDLVDIEDSPAFWSSSELALAQHLEDHANEIVSELAPLCRAADSADAAYFGQERVVKDLAPAGEWTSLPLLNNGLWNATACETIAPRTCALLKYRPELKGALWSASAPDTLLQNTFASVYRLRPGSRIHRHVGSQWRVNTHLGIVTPPDAKITVWNETRSWEVGKALAFLDAAEHHVEHTGVSDRCVLNVVSWHPSVLWRRLSDSVFAAHFEMKNVLATSKNVGFEDN